MNTFHGTYKWGGAPAPRFIVVCWSIYQFLMEQPVWYNGLQNTFCHCEMWEKGILSPLITKTSLPYSCIYCYIEWYGPTPTHQGSTLLLLPTAPTCCPIHGLPPVCLTMAPVYVATCTSRAREASKALNLFHPQF
jgi:hypothetical protein